jgi:hypothetical protein
MGTTESSRESTKTETEAWCCCSDPYAGLPADVQPKAREKQHNLRQATCPKCGLVYQTNRGTDVCIRCD